MKQLKTIKKPAPTYAMLILQVLNSEGGVMDRTALGRAVRDRKLQYNPELLGQSILNGVSSTLRALVADGVVVKQGDLIISAERATRLLSTLLRAGK